MNNILSIEVPIYNGEKYIENCINYLINQDYRDIQIVLIDDGSFDNSSIMIDRIVDNYENVLCIHQKNIGVLLSRLNGVKVSKGEYIGFMDVDDKIKSNIYKKLVDNLVKVDADISHCGLEIIKAGKRVNKKCSGKITIQNNKGGLVSLIKGNIIEPNLNNKVFKKDLFSNIDIKYRVNDFEDYLLNYLLFSNSKKTIYEDIALYSYIKNESSHTTNITLEERNKGYEYVLKKTIELSKNNKEIYKLNVDKLTNYWIHTYNGLIEDKKEISEEIREYKLKNMKAYSIKTKLQLFGISYMPTIYNFLYLAKRKYYKN